MNHPLTRQAGLAASCRILHQAELHIPPQSTIPLVAQRLPCSLIWIGAPTGTDGQAPANTATLYAGSKPDQTNIQGAQPLLSEDVLGVLLPVSDAARLYITNPSAQAQHLNMQILT